MTAYGIEVKQTDDGWTFPCECGDTLGGTSQEPLNIRNSIYDHRSKRGRHAQNLAKLVAA